MQRPNKSPHAPRGTAFFLFLCVAIVPISLRAAGFRVGLSPSFSAAIDAWHQITDVFGPGYQPASGADLSAPADATREPLKALDSSACGRSEFNLACETEQLPVSVRDVLKVHSPQARPAQGPCPSATSHAAANSTPVGSEVVSAASRTGLEKRTRAFEALSDIKFERVTREDLLTSIEKHLIERRLETVNNLAIPQSLRMLVRVKLPTIPSATKSPECKVRAALDSARRIERQRAILTGLSSTSPDNCEL
jgi:hypothetical protein